MFDSSPRAWRFYLDDMIDIVEKVLAYNPPHPTIPRAVGRAISPTYCANNHSPAGSATCCCGRSHPSHPMQVLPRRRPMGTAPLAN